MPGRGVQANLKHYINNEQEHFRNEGSSNLDSRTERELYLHPFLRGVQAGAASVMCSYNLINNSWACQNSELLNTVSRPSCSSRATSCRIGEPSMLGVASANAGLDMTMPGDVTCCSRQEGSLWVAISPTAVNNGSVATTRLDDMATRILAGWFLLGQDQGYPKPNFNFFDKKDPATNQFVMRPLITTRSHERLPALAQSCSRTVAMLCLYTSHATWLSLVPTPVLSTKAPTTGRTALERGLPYGTLGQGWGSGSTDYSYFFSPYESLQARARKDRTDMQWNFDDFNIAQSVMIANMTDVALVFVSAESGEGYITVDRNEGDRNNLTLWNQGEQLIRNVTAVNNNTVVIVHSTGAVDMESFAENPNVTAIVWANLPGSESGRALVDVLYGDYNPSGRLPYTIGKNRTDYSADCSTTTTRSLHRSTTPKRSTSTTVILTPRTSSRATSLATVCLIPNSTTLAPGRSRSVGRTTAGGARQNASSGLPEWLFQPKYEVTFSLTNSGNWDGHEVMAGLPRIPQVRRRAS